MRLTSPAQPRSEVCSSANPEECARVRKIDTAPHDPEARDRRIQRWILFSLGIAAAALVIVWLGFQLFAGDAAASKIALSFLSGLLGFVLRRPSA